MQKGYVLGGRYELIEHLGSGGMAHVWRTKDGRSGREVAVKFLRTNGDSAAASTDDEIHSELDHARGRFRREGALLGQLRHRGIPELYDQGVDHGDPYLVMRLVEGKALNDFMDQYTLTVGACAAIGVQIADALACAHDLPVVHRDLKPYNLIIDEYGIVVLIDFGIAKPLWPGVTDYTRHGSTVGSRHYQAPEQLLERQITPKTDLYAFGCVLYHLLTGHMPFSGDRLTDQHVHDLPLPPTCHVGHLPDELEELVLRLLAKRPEDRPADAREVAEVLRRYAPRPGDPAPDPRLEPDPTRPLRLPDDAQYERPTAPGSPRPAASARRRRAAFLSRRTFDEAVARARAETDSGEPKGALDALVELLPAARRDWGASDQATRAALRVAADGMRVVGRYRKAVELYERMARPPRDGEAPEDLADRLEGTLGAAECQMPFGDPFPALEALAHVIGALAERPELPVPYARRLEVRCREVAFELRQLEFGSQVDELLRSL
ncbi:serine/threonine-protein kinase [Streptomyces sp. NBC_00483]|uniref:serine/threonine-protein kinase n=1 Tax=Streptomyces sp. NBC_00483 TaxID=2975756 RepID=UPI002E170824